MCEIITVRGQDRSRPVLEQDKDFTARLRATIEEELGSFRQFADLPSVELEEIAGRLAKALRPMLSIGERQPESFAA
jgi:hypothetical protein